MAQQTEEREEGAKPDPITRAASSLKSSLPQALLLSQVSSKPRPYKPPVSLEISDTRAALHTRAIQDIAKARFAFPTPKYRDYKTYTNVPKRSMGVAMPNGAVAYPDIVVVQDPENYTKILGEVETSDTITDDMARYRWRPFSDLAPLYLYVPVGYADQARQLCRELKVPIVGLRTWRYATGVEEIEINDIFTVPSGPEELLPKILRPG